MILQVIRRRIFFDERVALGEVHAHGEGIGLGLLVHRLTDEHLSPHLQRKAAIHRGRLDIGKGGADGANGLEARLFHGSDCK
jgi:hypothetical protein